MTIIRVPAKAPKLTLVGKRKKVKNNKIANILQMIASGEYQPSSDQWVALQRILQNFTQKTFNFIENDNLNQPLMLQKCLGQLDENTSY